jgi:hypothetical protein
MEFSYSIAPHKIIYDDLIIDERGCPKRWDSLIRFGAIYSLTNLFHPIHALRSFEFLLEPFPKPRIIEPYSDHHHTEPKSG